MKTFYGKSGIKVTVLADSINAMGNRFITFEIEYPRLILAELNTHRALSKNSFSSRAVPFEKMLDQLTGIPVRFGANQAGMQDKGEDFDATVKIKAWEEVVDGGYTGLFIETEVEMDNWEAWEEAKDQAIATAKAFKDAGYHKQVYNRLLEPFQMMKTVISGTEWANFFWLRDDDAADPTLHELARVMREAAADSVPVLLKAGEWHLPYVDCYWLDDDEANHGRQVFYIWPDEATLAAKPADEAITMADMITLSLEDAIKVACARCAAVSYRNEGYGHEKSVDLYYKLVGSERKHASALEHCGTPMYEPPPIRSPEGVLVGGKGLNVPYWPETWAEGVSHVDRNGKLWSGNLCGWIQYRKLVKGENYTG